MSTNRKSKHYGCSKKRTISRSFRNDSFKPLSPLLQESRSRQSSSLQSSSSTHERRVVESDETMLSSNNICQWIQTETKKYNSLKAKYDELLNELHGERVDNERLNCHVGRLEQEAIGYRQDLEKLEKVAQDHANQCVPLRNDLKTTQAKLKENMDELHKKRDENKKFLEEIKKLNAKITTLSSSNQSYEARERKMKTDLEKLRSEFENEKKEKEQLKIDLGARNEEITNLQERNQKLDRKVHRFVQFVNENIFVENDKMLKMFIAAQEGTANTMKVFIDSYNEEMGTEKIRMEDWGKLQVPHSKSLEDVATRAIMPEQENNGVINSTNYDDGDVGSGTGPIAKRGADDDGDGDVVDNTPLKRSRTSSCMENDGNGKCMRRGEEEQQNGVTPEQQYEMDVGTSVSMDVEDSGNEFHEYISSPSESDFATASATSSSSSEDETTRFIKKEPVDIDSSTKNTNNIRKSYIASGLRSWSD